jgi:K(+)-stimulated pyrophosphate-energized sodium pump
MPDSALSGGDMVLVAVVLVVALAALGFAGFLVRAVLAADQGTQTMRDIARAVQEGAAAYLRRQFRTLSVFAVIVFLLLIALPVSEGGWGTRLGRAVFFLVGALFSAMVGFIGMTLATRGNVRVAAAARSGGYRPAFRIAYRTGGVVGMITVGLGLFGAALALLLFD